MKKELHFFRSKIKFTLIVKFFAILFLSALSVNPANAEISVIFGDADPGDRNLGEICQTSSSLYISLDSDGFEPFTFDIIDDPGGIAGIVFGDLLVIDISRDNPPGDYTVTVEVTDDGGRTGSNVLSYELLETPEQPTITTVNNDPTEFCSGESVTLEASYSEHTYQWLKDGVEIPGADGQTYLVDEEEPGSYSYRVRLTHTETGCSTTSTATIITVYPNPEPVPTISPNPVCEGSDAEFDVSVGDHEANIITYYWEGPEGFTENQKSFTRINIQLNDAGIYNIWVEDENGCSGESDIELFVDPLPIEPDEAIVDPEETLCHEYEGNVTLTAIGGSPPEYNHTLRWYTDGCGTTFVGEGVELEIEAPDEPTTYYARWESEDCGVSDCASVLVDVYDPLDGGTIEPDFQQICYDEIPQDIEGIEDASGGSMPPYNYIWQYREEGEIDWTNIDGSENQSDLEFTSELTVSTEFRRLAIDNICGTVASNIVTVSVYDELTGGIISEDQSICFGEEPEEFTNDEPAQGGSGSGFYQWEYMEDGDPDWTALPGTDSETYSAGELETTTYFRRVFYDDECGFAISDTIEVEVYGELDPGIIGFEDPGDNEICYGAIPNKIIEIEEPDGGFGGWTFRWEYRIVGDPDWIEIPGEVGPEYEATDYIYESKEYRRIAVNDVCGEVASDPVTVTVYDELDGGEISPDQELCYGDIPADIIGTEPAGGSPDPGAWTYQWEYREEGEVNWETIPGADGQNLTFTDGITITTHFRRLAINDPCGSVYSNNIVTITVTEELLPGEIAEDQSICYGTTPEPFTSVSSGSGGTGEDSYQWQFRDEGSVWEDIPGATDVVYAETDNLFISRYYRRVFYNDCGDTISNTIEVEVYGELDAVVVVTDVSECYENNNGSIEITDPEGGSGVYEYSIYHIEDDVQWGWQSDPTFDELYAGNYEVYIRDTEFGENCEVFLGTYEIDQPEELSASLDWEHITECFDEDNGWIRIIDPQGGYGNGELDGYQYTINGGVSWENSIELEEGLDYVQYNDLIAGNYNVQIRDADYPGCFIILDEELTLEAPDELGANDIELTHVTCAGGNNGKIEIIGPFGGSGNFEFSINIGANEWQVETTFTDLSFGNYEVYIRDADFPDCFTLLEEVTISEPDPLTADVDHEDVSCFGYDNGQIIITNPGGGSGNYQFSIDGIDWVDWTPDELIFEPLEPDTYDVYIRDADDEACIELLATVEIEEPGEIVLDFDITPVDCYGAATGEVTVTVTEGGTPDFTYSWTGPDGFTSDQATITELVAGEYTVVVTDSQDCTATGSAYVWQADEPLYANAGSDGYICSPSNDGTQVEHILGGTATWPTGDGGEPFYDPVEDEYYYEYHWTADPPDASLDGQEHLANPIVTPAETTTYTVEVTDALGCVVFDNTVVTVHPTIIADAGGDENGFVYICEGTIINLGGTPLGEGPTGYYLNDPDPDPDQFTYNWREIDPNSVYIGDEQHPEVSPTETTTYRVRVWDYDGPGCWTFDTVTVEVWDPIIVDAYATPSEMCHPNNNDGSEVTLEATIDPIEPEEGSYEYLWTADPPYDFEGQENELEPIVSPSVTTTFTLHVSTTAGIGCDGYDDVVVTVHPEIVADAGEDGVLCDPATETYILGGDPTAEYADDIAGDFTYQWIADPPDSSLDGQENDENPEVSPTETTTYYLTVFDEHGCSEIDDVTITVADEILTAYFDPDEVDLDCYGDIYDTEVIVEGGVAPYSYAWDPEPLDHNENLATLEAGEYTVTVVDDLGCEVIASITVTEPDQLVIDEESIFVTDIICHGTEDGEISITALGGTGNLYYTLYEEGVIDPVAGPQVNDGTFADLPAGTYYVEVTDDNDCGPVVSPLLTIEELDDTYAGEDVTICIGESVQLGPDEAVPGMIYEWTSDPDDPESISDPNIHNPWVYPTVTTTYTLWEEYPDMGCVNSASVVVTVEGEYMDEEEHEICMYESIELGIEPDENYEYEWFSSNPEEDIDEETSYIVVNPLINTTYTLREYIPGTEGIEGEMCYNVYDFIIIVNPLPRADAGEDKEICLGDTIQIGGDYSDPLPANEFMWTSEPEDAFISDPTVANPLVSPTVTTTFTLTETYLETGCIESNSIIVKVFPDFDAIAGNYGPYCENETIELYSLPDGYDYQWSGPGGWTSSEQNPEIPDATFDMAGIYTVTITGEFGDSGLTCNTTAETEVEIYEAPVPFVADDILFCSEDDVDSVHIGGDAIEGYTYYWESNPEDEGLITDIANPLVKPDTTTVYTLWVTNEWGCTATDSVKITISDFIVILHDDPALCEDDEQVYLGDHIEIRGGEPPYVYTWSDVEGNVFSNSRNPFVTRPLDPYLPYVIFTVGDQQDCFITENVFIREIETPIVDLRVEPTNNPLPGQTLTFIATPDNYHSYDFYVDGELKQSGSDNTYQTSQIKDEQEIWVIASYFGCEGISNTITIFIKDLPNAFIPDSDFEENRIFAKGVQLVVFNRWGQKLYEGNDGWDGTYRGRRVAPGTYYYIATVYDANNNKTELKGSVTVIVQAQ